MCSSMTGPSPTRWCGRRRGTTRSPVPCTLNGTAPPRDGLAEAVHARVAGRVVGAGAGTRRPSARASCEPGDHGRVGPTAARTPGSASRTAAASVDAASAALPHEAMASGGRSAAPTTAPGRRVSAATQVQQDRRTGAGPCGCRRRVPVSSFTQTPPSARKPSASLSASARSNGVVTNPVPATAATCASSSCDQRDAGGVVEPDAPRRTRPTPGSGGRRGTGSCSPARAAARCLLHDLRARGAGRLPVAFGQRHGNGCGDRRRRRRTTAHRSSR